MKTILKIIILILLNSNPTWVFCQKADTLRPKSKCYLVNGGGISHSSFRDMGVSPLTYSSWLGNLSLGYRAIKPYSMFEIQSLADAGVYQVLAGGTYYKTQAVNVRTSANYFINFPTNNNIQFFMGGGLTHFISTRISSQYMNAGFVLDNYMLLSVNTRLQRAFVIPAVERNIWFLNYSKGERLWEVSAYLLMPFAGVLLRPGFSYVSHSTTNNNQLLEDYQWHALVFSGTTARISLTRFLNNGNAYEFGYNFHVFTSKNYLTNSLQMATQTLGFSLIYRFK